jgi:signal-transduction protein with cAMP-binding, CBS, and nucleotidyltransferase domain
LILAIKKQQLTGAVIDFSKISELLNRLSFFKKFPSMTSQKIFEKSSLIVYQKDDVIFNQGDSSPDFFLLLRGSVSISSRKRQYEDVVQIVKTYYDGA